MNFGGFSRGMWLIVVLCGGASSAEPGSPLVRQADVAVVSATPAGIAAAVAAARCGRSVLVLESTRHVGGIITSGLTNADIINRKAIAGLFDEFRARVDRHYRTVYGEKSPEVKLAGGGYYFEPKVAEQIYLDMMAAESPRITVCYGYRPVQATRQGARVVEVLFDDLANRTRVAVRAKVFVDATYEGDVAALAGAEYRVGRESRDELGEPHAGRIYMQFGTTEPLPGSTGEADRGIQAFCFRITVTRDPKNRVPIEKPAAYQVDDYLPLVEDLRAGRVKKLRDAIQLWPMPGNKIELNSDHITSVERGPSESLDLAEEVWDYPEAGPAKREAIFRRVWNYNVGLIWFLANDPRVPESIRKDAAELGFCRDEFTDNGNRPWQMYVREGRRIVGRYFFTENDGRIVADERTRVQPSSIAICEFPWDSHAVHKYDPAHPGVREGYFYVKHPPAQVPYEVLLPAKVDGLLVPVCASSSHVGYQGLRVEPTFMALGQAAGVAAHFSIARRVPLHEVPIGEVQVKLIEQHAIITHFEDLPTTHRAFAAFQFLGTRGFNAGYHAQADQPIDRRGAWERLGRLLRYSKRTALTEPVGEGPLTVDDVRGWFKTLEWPVVEARLVSLSQRPLTVADFAELVYDACPDRPL